MAFNNAGIQVPPSDAADEPIDFCRRLGRVLGEELAGLLGRDDGERFRSRLHRYRHLGR